MRREQIGQRHRNATGAADLRGLGARQAQPDRAGGPPQRPGLLRVASGGSQIEVEVCQKSRKLPRYLKLALSLRTELNIPVHGGKRLVVGNGIMKASMFALQKT